MRESRDITKKILGGKRAASTGNMFLRRSKRIRIRVDYREEVIWKRITDGPHEELSDDEKTSAAVSSRVKSRKSRTEYTEMKKIPAGSSLVIGTEKILAWIQERLQGRSSLIVDPRRLSTHLGIPIRRTYDVLNVLEGMGILHRETISGGNVLYYEDSKDFSNKLKHIKESVGAIQRECTDEDTLNKQVVELCLSTADKDNTSSLAQYALLLIHFFVTTMDKPCIVVDLAHRVHHANSKLGKLSQMRRSRQSVDQIVRRLYDALAILRGLRLAEYATESLKGFRGKMRRTKPITFNMNLFDQLLSVPDILPLVTGRSEESLSNDEATNNNDVGLVSMAGYGSPKQESSHSISNWPFPSPGMLNSTTDTYELDFLLECIVDCEMIKENHARPTLSTPIRRTHCDSVTPLSIESNSSNNASQPLLLLPPWAGDEFPLNEKGFQETVASI